MQKLLLLLSLFVGQAFAQEQISLNEIGCEELESIKGLKLENRCQRIILNKTKGYESIGGFKNNDIFQLIVEGEEWNEGDLIELSNIFPNVNSITCDNCNIHKLNGFNVFNKIKHLKLDYFDVPRTTPDSPYYIISFDYLNYEKIDRIDIVNSNITNISCRDLGVWGSKINSRRTSSELVPYRDVEACFPEMEKVSSSILSGDLHYKNEDIKGAHNQYLRAFNRNPYNRKVISNLSLTFYKLGEYCKSSEISYFGLSLLEQDVKRDSSIWYNFHLSLSELNLNTLALEALENSKRVKLGKKADLKLFNNFKCSSSTWILDYVSEIEKEAVKRTRNRAFKTQGSYHSFVTGQGKEYQPTPRNHIDRDGSGSGDWVEFEYKKGLDGQCRCEPFNTFLIELPKSANIDETFITFKYFGSDPLKLTRHNYHDKAGYFKMPEPGIFRLWIKNSDEVRNPKSFSNGGDYLEPFKQYSVKDLNHDSKTKTIEVYVEGIDFLYKSTPVYIDGIELELKWDAKKSKV